MAKGNIVRWITVKGRRVPIYEDGSMGGFMEGKQHQEEKKSKDDKIKSNIGVSHESNSHDNEVLRIRDELDSGKSTTTSNKEIADMYKNSPKKAFDVKDNGDGTYEISKKEQSVFGKEFQDKADAYREKFLTKRSDEEIAEIKKNLDKSTGIVGTTEEDHVTYKAIEDEMSRRKSGKTKTGPLSKMTNDQVMDAALKGDKNAIDEMSHRGLSTTKDLQAYKNKQKSIKVGNKTVSVQSNLGDIPNMSTDELKDRKLEIMEITHNIGGKRQLTDNEKRLYREELRDINSEILKRNRKKK